MNENLDNFPSITKSFLQNALGNEVKIPSYKVTSGMKPGDNFMSLIYNIEVQTEHEGNKSTRYLFMKCYPNHPSRQKSLNNRNIFFKEFQIYKIWFSELERFQIEVIRLDEADTIKLPFAQFVYGKCIDYYSNETKHIEGKVYDSLDNFIILEDVCKTLGYKMTNRRHTLDIDHMRLAVEALAKVHSLSWAYKNQVEQDLYSKFPFLEKKMRPEGLEMWGNILNNNIGLAIKTLNKTLGMENELSLAVKKFKDIARLLFEAFMVGKKAMNLEQYLRVKPENILEDDANAEPWLVISHGDCWSNNLLFRYKKETAKPEEIILVDFPMAQETCILNDLVYLICTGTSGELRKTHLEELLEFYHEKFNAFCKQLQCPTLPGFTLETFKRRFHAAKLMGFSIALLTMPIDLQEEEKAGVLDDVDENKSLKEIMTEHCSGSESNSAYQQRLLELTQDMFDQGVI